MKQDKGKTKHINYWKTELHKYKLAPTLALKWYLQPVKIRAANAFSARTFPVWPAKRRVLQSAVCHLPPRIGSK